MSIPVALDRLREQVATCTAAPYLLTVGDDGRPHSVACSPRWDGATMVIAAGKRSVANASARPLVTLLWPPSEPGGYSLIVDGEAVAAELPEAGPRQVTFRPTGAVLHRAAPGAITGDGSPTADCAPV